MITQIGTLNLSKFVNVTALNFKNGHFNFVMNYVNNKKFFHY